MNKAQLIEQMARRSGHPIEVVADCLAAFQDTVVRTVHKREKVMLTGFVTFEPVNRRGRYARNPQTGERVFVAKKKDVRIRPGAGFKAVVNGQRKLPRSGIAIMKATKGSVMQANATGEKPTLSSRPTVKKVAARPTQERPVVRKTAQAKKTAPAKKATARKTTAKRSPAKKTTAKKATSKRTARG